jgi:acetyl-CoA carboxylase carboxyltransferase component
VSAGIEDGGTTEEPLGEFERRRSAIRTQMGGADRIDRLHAGGARTARERLNALLDQDSFSELGTFAASSRPEDRTTTPGDGRIVGFGYIDGRPVGVAADDATVRGASAATVNIRKIDRVFQASAKAGHPFVYLGETRGSRIPDSLGSEGLSEVSGEAVTWTRRMRRMPMATVITGPSFGGSSFIAAMSDLVIQIEGTCLAVASPRVIEAATGEKTTFEELGGTEVHSFVTGEIDVAASDEGQALTFVHRWLSFLPSNNEQSPPRATSVDPPGRQPVSQIVPGERRRGYDMRRLVSELVDGGDFLELKPHFGPGLVTGLARIDGWPVGILASNPMFQAGTLDPNACDKGTRLLCLCDAFNLPVILLHDSPGFLVGKQVEHNRLINKTILFLQALMQLTVPRLSVIVRKSYGLSYTSLGGAGTESDLLVAWPGAEIGFMDPDVAANVLYGDTLSALHGEPKATKLGELATGLRRDNQPYSAAASMALDEVIHPDETRTVLAETLARWSGRTPPPPSARPLTAWPTSW